MNPNRFPPLKIISALLVSLLLLAGCFNQNDGQGPQTGGIAAQIVWPEQQPAGSSSEGFLLASLDSPGFSPLDAPAGVVKIRITVSGADFTSQQTSFTAIPGSPGSGTMWGIPVGTNRSITVEGLNAVDTPLYQGTVIGITISAGVAEAVTVPLSLISSIPPAIPTITLPAVSPYYTSTRPITLSGACTDATAHTVNLTGDQTGSVTCASSAYSFSLNQAGEGVFGYSVTQTDDTTLLISPSDSVTWILDWTAPAAVGIVGPASNPETSSGSTLMLQGTCETGATVTLSGDDAQTTTCVASAFTFTIMETANATYNYAVSQTDLAGNVSASSTPFTWIRVSANPDTPTITSPAATPYYTSTWPGSIAGGCDSSSPHTVNLSGDAIDSASCASSAFSFAVAQPGSDGTYVYYVSQTNGVPVTSGDATVIIVFDRAAPASVILTSPAASPYTASGATLNISGTCETDTTVTLAGDDTQTTSCVSGLFVFSISEVDDGLYTYTINQTDLAGNVSSDVTQVWVRDNAPPVTPTITTPAANPFYSNAALTLSGACTSSTAHTVYLTGDATDQVACAGSSYSFLVSPGSDGTYTLNVSQARDATGATSSTVSQTWILDTVVPADPAITSPVAFQTVSSGNTFDIVGTCDTGEIINLTGDDSQTWTCSGGAFTFTITKTVDGTYNFSVHQSDLAGNTSGVLTRQWVRDSAVPSTPTFSSPGSNPYYSNTLLAGISGACTSTVPHTVNMTGQETGSTACAGSAFNFTLADPGGDGSYTYNFAQTNDGTASTSGTATLTWVYDRVAPGSVTITTPASSPVTTTTSALTISGACETNATVNLTGDDTQSTTCSGSAYYFSVSKGTDGTYNFSVTQTDQAGNTALTPATQQWVRDTVVPGTPTITTTNPTLTNSAPIALDGTCTSTTAHTVNLTGQETKSVACSASAYNFSLLDPGSDGSFAYNVSQTKDSNVLTSGTVGFTWNLDTTAPATVTVTSPASSPVVSTANSLIISGGCETGALVVISGDLVDSFTCAASAYTFTANETVNGTYDYSLSQTDPAGNPAASSVAVQWVKNLPAFTVAPTAISSAEGDAATAVSVSISTPPDGDVVVDVVSSDTSEATVDTATLTFNAGNWESAQTVNITPVADLTVDSNQTVTVALTVNAGSTTDTTGYAALDPDDVSVTVTDVDGFGITVTPTSGLITDETATTDSFTVVLNKIPTDDVVIKVESQDTSEVTVDSDPMTLTFTTTDWDTPQTVTVTGVDDAAVDGTQVVTVALTIDPSNTDVVYGALEPDDVTVSNGDDDGPGITVSPVSGLITDEAGGSDTFTVVLNKLPDGDVVIDVVSLDSTEVAVDKATLTFTTSDWFTAQTVTVTGQNDAVADGNQTVTVALTINGGSTTDGTGYAALNPADVSVLNSDNDTPGVTVSPVSLVTSESGTTASFFVFLNTQPAAGKIVVIDVASLDSTEAAVDKASLTFTEADWSTVQTVTVTGQSDSTVDGNQTAIVALTIGAGTDDTTGYAALDPPDVSVLNSDIDVAGFTVTPTSLTTSEDGTQDTFSVRLNTRPATGTVVEILVQSGDTSEVTVDKATLTFDELDWSTPQIVTALGVNDALTDGNQIVNIALITDTLVTTDGNYDLVDPTDVTVTNLDNTPGVTLTPTSGLITDEAGGTDSFTVQLNVSPAAATVVIIDVASADTNEVTVDTAQLTFTDADWATPQTVTVTGVDDFPVNDSSQLVSIDLTMNTGGTTDPAYDPLGPFAVTVTNIGDIVEVIVTPTSGLITDEVGATDSFTVALSALPTGDVVIDVASSDTLEITVDKSQLTFTTADWMTAQTVTVKGVNDTLTDGDYAGSILLTMNASTDGSAPEYGTPLDPTDPTVTNLDNESPNEGTPGGPVDITGTLPIEGSVGATSSYYTVTGLSDGTSYFVSLSSVSQDVELFVYPDTSDYNPVNELCTSNNYADPRPEACIATATVSTIFVIRVDVLSGTTGGTYSINVTPVPASVGSAGSPSDITSSLPGYLGGLDGTPSYYVVTGLAASTAYRVQLGNLTDNVDLEVWDDATFAGTMLCSANASSIAETCEATSTGAGEVYIYVVNAAGSTDVAFYLDIMDPLFDEGTSGSPVDLTGLIPYEGMVKTTASYYSVSSLVPSAIYSVELINMAGQGALEVYTDNTYTTTSCTSDLAGNWPESCSVAASASGIVYFAAVPGGGFSSAGATFRVLIK